ncbi:periplasmic protease [Idiomarina sp. A28L]|uniref:S41 family peptidase n=1 Tax=Idiomarina sp. A28L TaxID=1036674 RepID=UPI0002138A3C|nr:PDZ domain-containing protein [Idiomarina sp. A28L]EGN75026.1 periplasmic protease [Idiomarina sp. A28L]
MKTSTLTALALTLPGFLLISGCVDTRPMYERAAMQSLANAANSAVPGGKAQPALNVDEMQHYHAVVAHYKSWANNMETFNTSNAIPCDIDQNTAYIIAQNVPMNVTKSLMRTGDRSLNRTSTMSPISAHLISGECNEGKISGPFEAIVQYSMQIRLPNNTQQSVTYNARIAGNLNDNVQRGQWQSISSVRSQSEYFGSDQTTWSAQRYGFENNQIAGTQITYAEFPQLNSITVTDSPYNNEMRRVRTFTGSNLSNMYTTFQGAIYGWFYTYHNNQVLATSCMWQNQNMAESVCYRFSVNSPLSEFVGIGIILPPDLRGRFQVHGLFHPSSASKEGLTVGDTILAINGVALTEMHDTTYVQSNLRGPEGSTVTVTVLTEGAIQSKEIELTRSRIRNPTLSN